MRILAIETSCDETAAAVVEGSGKLNNPQFTVHSSEVLSQIELHAAWGGVVPNLARREHEKNLTYVIEGALKKADLLKKEEKRDISTTYLEREAELKKALTDFLAQHSTPEIDAIAVTSGPGLEPALWVGINAARTLAENWEKPLIAVNHMEGHLLAALLSEKHPRVIFPALALLVSGGHTELVLIKKWGAYEIIGETRDDAAGEAFDKTARILKLPYPGGPALSKLALSGESNIELPRPMFKTKDYDFSFSGLKTAVLYYFRDNPSTNTADLAASIQEAIVDVLSTKTFRAADAYKIKTIMIGGGVAANTELRERFQRLNKSSARELILPDPKLTTDNAAMIGAAAYIRALKHDFSELGNVHANSSLRLF